MLKKLEERLNVLEMKVIKKPVKHLQIKPSVYEMKNTLDGINSIMSIAE